MNEINSKMDWFDHWRFKNIWDDLIKHDDYFGHVTKILKNNYYEIFFGFSIEKLHSEDFRLATKKDLQ